MCASLQSGVHLHLSAPLTFTNTGFYWLKASPKGSSLESFPMLYQKKKKKKQKNKLGYSIVCYAGNHWVCVTLCGIPRRDGWQYQVLNDKKIS